MPATTATTMTAPRRLLHAQAEARVLMLAGNPRPSGGSARRFAACPSAALRRGELGVDHLRGDAGVADHDGGAWLGLAPEDRERDRAVGG